MGWNEGYRIMETQVIALYDAEMLTPEILDKIMEPFKDTDCDSGGSRNLKTIDGKNAEEVICRVMEPEKWQDAIVNPEYSDGYEDCWENNDKAYQLFHSIWRDKWGIW